MNELIDPFDTFNEMQNQTMQARLLGTYLMVTLSCGVMERRIPNAEGGVPSKSRIDL